MATHSIFCTKADSNRPVRESERLWNRESSLTSSFPAHQMFPCSSEWSSRLCNKQRCLRQVQVAIKVLTTKRIASYHKQINRGRLQVDGCVTSAWRRAKCNRSQTTLYLFSRRTPLKSVEAIASAKGHRQGYSVFLIALYAFSMCEGHI